ncbi:MAG: transposase [Deltaproteobacteria bacterium]|nr:transposase [Deltaproteobacteria bacterium]
MRHNRRSIRLHGYDYSRAGVYFVTICAWNRECLFGDAMDGRTILNDFGQKVAESWEWLAIRHGYAELDEWVIMPNRLHGIIVITDVFKGGSRTAPTKNRKPIGRLVGAFKTVSTKRINHLRDTPGVRIWQRNYYEHIIRDDEELNRIREYIANNPAQWETDRENPNVVVGAAFKKEFIGSSY